MSSGGCHFTAVDSYRTTVGAADENETATPDARIWAINNSQHQAGGNCRIHRVPAILEYPHRRISSLWMHRRHHPTLCRSVGQTGLLDAAEQLRQEHKQARDR